MNIFQRIVHLALELIVVMVGSMLEAVASTLSHGIFLFLCAAMIGIIVVFGTKALHGLFAYDPEDPRTWPTTPDHPAGPQDTRSASLPDDERPVHQEPRP